MKRVVFALAAFVVLHAQPVLGLTDADLAALKQLTEDYVSWSYSGRPIKFSERLDYKSFEPQKTILIKLAEIQWAGTWGDYWQRREVKDLKKLRSFSPKDFWVHFHSVVKQEAQGNHHDAETSVAIPAITEARDYAYVIYQAAYPLARTHENEDKLEVLRARFTAGEWRLVAFPNVTASLRRQLEAAESKK